MNILDRPDQFIPEHIAQAADQLREWMMKNKVQEIHGLTFAGPGLPIPCIQVTSDEALQMSYHDVVVYVDGVEFIPSTNYALQLTCCKAAGWRLWRKWEGKEELIGGEFDNGEMCIVVKGLVILGEVPAEPRQPNGFGWTGEVTRDD